MPKKDLIIIAALTLFMLTLAGAGVGIMLWQHGGFGDKPEDAPKFVAEGDAALRALDEDQAIRMYTRALGADPQHIRAWLGRGNAQLARGAAGDAAADFRKALELDPGRVEGHIGLALVATQLGDPQTALDHFRRGAEIAPDDAALLAVAAAMLPQTNESMAVFDQIIESGAAGEAAYAQRARMRAAIGDLSGAIDDYSSAIERSTFPDWAYREARGDLFMQIGAFEDAASDFRSALATGMRGDPNLMLDYAWAMWGLSEPQQAADALSNLIKSGQRVGLPHFFSLGASYLQLEENEAAAQALERAVSFKTQGRDYASLFRWIADARVEGPDHADAHLRGTLASVDYRFRAYARRLAEFLLGERSEETLIAELDQPGPDQTALQKACEGWFYIGARRLLDGDLAGARQAFEASAATNVRTYYEWHASRAELSRMADD